MGVFNYLIDGHQCIKVLFFLLMMPALTPSFSARGQNYWQLTDVPTVYIQTENSQSITSNEEYINCTLTYVDGDSVATFPNTKIRGRGNSSWWYSPKKSYRIKFAEKQRLLGKDFANARSWTLLANHGDKTMIRNALTYDLGRFMGLKFCPAARFIDLYINGSYRGTYQISDQVHAHKRRVEIEENSGWLLEATNDNTKEPPYFSTSRGVLYNIKNPDDEMLTVNTRIAIAQHMQLFELALFSNDFTDDTSGYHSFVDMEDLVNWYVAAEITGNIDALYSIYLYRNGADDVIHFGPLWDLELGYDNSSERSLLRNMEAFLGLYNRPYEQYIQRMWTDPWFASACKQRLDQLIDNGLEQHLLNHIDSLRNAIYQSQLQNYRIWGIDTKVYDWEKHTYHRTYDEYITDLKNFVNIHIPYLQQAFKALCPYDEVNELKCDELENSDNCYYNLNGQRIDKPERGVFIHRGRIIYVIN